MAEKEPGGSSPEDPTQPMPAVPDDDATRVLPAVPRAPQEMPPMVAPPSTGSPHVPPPTAQRSRAASFAIWLAVILLGLLVVSVLGALISRGGWFAPGPSASPSETASESASASPSPSVTPSPSPSPSPTPEPTETTPAGPQFTSFAAPAQAVCPDEMTTAEVALSWTSSGATRAWVGIATSNAKAEPYSEVPPSGAATLPFPCSNASQVYTVTLEDGSGNLAHQSATVTRALP